MNLKQKLINILKLHSELAAEQAAAQIQFEKEKLKIIHELVYEKGHRERNFNQSLTRRLPSYPRLKEIELVLNDFWASLEPELTELLRAALPQALEAAKEEKTKQHLNKLKFDLAIGKRFSAMSIRRIAELLPE